MSTEPVVAPSFPSRSGEVIELDPGISRRADPHVLVIFGASGDLAARKILPALAALAIRGSLPKEFVVVGIARSELSDEEFRELYHKAGPEQGAERWHELADHFRYLPGDYADGSITA
jgi:glucose-6-phosphate 1-dehydrogenase